MPAAVNAALIAVTAFRVSPAWKASAANNGPSRRLTNREYAGAPAAPFCAADNRRRVAPSPTAAGSPGRESTTAVTCASVSSVPVGDTVQRTDVVTLNQHRRPALSTGPLPGPPSPARVTRHGGTSRRRPVPVTFGHGNGASFVLFRPSAAMPLQLSKRPAPGPVALPDR